jgi:hypothetical protein
MDKRFEELQTQPKFMPMAKKKKQVKVDKKRFGKLFEQGDEDFNVISKFDKRGEKIEKRDQMLGKLYQAEDQSDESAVDGDKFYDKEGNFRWEKQSESAESEVADKVESDDDEEREEDEENMWDAQAEIPQGELEDDS